MLVYQIKTPMISPLLCPGPRRNLCLEFGTELGSQRGARLAKGVNAVGELLGE